MQGITIVYGLVGALAIALLVAAFTDIRRRQIDNWLNATIALAAPAFWWAMGWHLWPDIALQLGMMGGGDVKLLAALALWLPAKPFFELLLIMALAGGVLTVVMGMWHIMHRRKDRLKIPYGIAIAAAGLWVIGTTDWAAFQTMTVG